ncbi:fatty acyl-AMP ligase [Streptomyces boncukensis]|uniref:Fatty acyl-AMP ligase n=1 Tax=Streptomyces boncukensis TaxID=2711219 RepID=A0A6G4WQP5_9ACTN|nr:fatty acyl-AMP ligase [Streptomyces boncukensis]NGO66947.1 fatty acyl-AMP ligase [Streptomyces boncukensis]
MIQQHVQRGDRTAFSFIRDAKNGEVSNTLTYRELDASARGIAARLTADGGPGQRVLLLFPDGLDFVKAFVGCLYAGAVAVPAPLPDRFRTAADRAAGILRDAGAGTVLTDRAHLDSVRAWLRAQGAPGTACADAGTLAGTAETRSPPAPPPESLAFLQYTSGSTSEPKGVMVSHGNLLANLESIHRTIGGTPELSAVGWLPVIHDMGLVGQLLSVLRAGGHLVLMPPNEFLRRPHRWLSLVQEFRATHTAAPNFAFDLCLRRITDEQAASLDLTSLEVVLNGAEPVRADTMAAFADRFARAGFDPAAFSPCYGMAEATLFVSGSPRLEPPVTAAADPEALAEGVLRPAAPGAAQRRLVSSGRPLGASVAIVDTGTGEVLPDGLVGEIRVRGAAVAQGYWRRGALTRETFGQTTAVPGAEEGWLRTGDLGAMRAGELFVTGRLKDVVIVGGRNLYPQDMEYVLQRADEHLLADAGAVFGRTAGSADVVVVQEARPVLFRSGDPEEVAGKIRRALAREFDISPRTVLLTRPGTVRKTTSGKVRRSLMRQLFIDGALEGAGYRTDVPAGASAGQRGQ